MVDFYNALKELIKVITMIILINYAELIIKAVYEIRLKLFL
jgi:hypothetical protein